MRNRLFHLRSELFPYIYSSAWERLHRIRSAEFARCTSSIPPGKKPTAIRSVLLRVTTLLVAPITSAGEGTNKVAQQTFGGHRRLVRLVHRRAFHRGSKRGSFSA